MHRPETLRDGSLCPYGFGCMVGTRGDSRYVHHSGSIRGFASQMAWYPERDITIVVLSNLQSFPAVEFGGNLADAILEA